MDFLGEQLTALPEAIAKSTSFVANTGVTMRELIFVDDVEVFLIPRLQDGSME